MIIGSIGCLGAVVLMILAMIVWPILSAFMAIKRGASSFTGNASRQQQRQQNQEPKRRKKIFSRNDGEYVDYEDIAGRKTSTTTTTTERYESEPQVEDAEWEEIK